jgi:hypothetical protein
MDPEDEDFNIDDYEAVTDPEELLPLVGKAGLAAAIKASKLATSKGDVLDTAPVGTVGKQQDGWNKYAAARETIKSLNKIRTEYSKNFSKGGLAGLKEYNPGSDINSAFDASVANLLGPAKAAQRAPGEGPFTDADLKQLEGTLPNRWRLDGGNLSSMETLDAQLRGHMRNGLGSAGVGIKDIERAIASNVWEGLPSAPPAEAEEQQPGSVEPNELLQQLVAKGDNAQIVEFLKSMKIDPETVMPSIEAFQAQKKLNPDYVPDSHTVIGEAPALPSASADDLRKKYGLQ